METTENQAYREEEHLENGMRRPFESHIQSLHGRGIMSDPHYHEYIEILYGMEGEIRVFLDGKSYDFSTGDMILINSNEIHAVTSCSDSANQYLVVKFEPELLYTTNQTVFEARYLTPFTTTGHAHQKRFSAQELKDTFLPAALLEIYQEYQQREYGFELAIRADICQIFLWILRSWNREDNALDRGKMLNEHTISWLQQVFGYVQKNYQGKVSVEQAASVCGMSYHYFSRCFKKIMKKGFSEYVNFFRISQAEKLLMTSELNITEIAMEVGFSSSSYFIEQFRLYKGISPKRFRRELLSNS